MARTDEEREGVLRAVFLCEFDNQVGRTLAHQAPRDYISAEEFDAISDYLIPKPQLCGRLIAISSEGGTLHIHMPICPRTLMTRLMCSSFSAYMWLMCLICLCAVPSCPQIAWCSAGQCAWRMRDISETLCSLPWDSCCRKDATLHAQPRHCVELFKSSPPSFRH
eukprot:3129593-Pleurochrysis_carterae.AAC.1